MASTDVDQPSAESGGDGIGLKVTPANAPARTAL
jgi:hypothetical protein